MKRPVLFFAFLWLLSLPALAQPAGYQHLNGSDATEMAKKIKMASAQMKSLKVNFKQEKISKIFTDKVTCFGKMWYKKPNFLRWSYTSPNVYSIILNEKGAFFKNAKGTTKNKTLGELGALLARTIGGDGLIADSNFSVDYYQKTDILVIVKPKVKKMQELYSQIEVYLNPATCLATQVKMTEKNGDVTLIHFSGHQKNITIANAEFEEN